MPPTKSAAPFVVSAAAATVSGFLSEMSDSSEKGSTSVKLVTLHSTLSHATSHIDALVQVVWCELQGRAEYLQSIITG